VKFNKNVAFGRLILPSDMTYLLLNPLQSEFYITLMFMWHFVDPPPPFECHELFECPLSIFLKETSVDISFSIKLQINDTELIIYHFPRCLPAVELRLVLVTPDLDLAHLVTPGDTPGQGPDRSRQEADPTVVEVTGSLNLLCPFSS